MVRKWFPRIGGFARTCVIGNSDIAQFDVPRKVWRGRRVPVILRAALIRGPGKHVGCRSFLAKIRIEGRYARVITGKDADAALGRANITVNKNAVPNDPQSPFVTSGLRLGTPAITTRGFGADETRELTGWIADILDDINNEETIERVRGQVLDLCKRFPVYD